MNSLFCSAVREGCQRAVLIQMPGHRWWRIDALLFIRVDAEAIGEAAQRPNMRLGAVKTIEHQAIYYMRSPVVDRRTAQRGMSKYQDK